MFRHSCACAPYFLILLDFLTQMLRYAIVYLNTLLQSSRVQSTNKILRKLCLTCLLGSKKACSVKYFQVFSSLMLIVVSAELSCFKTNKFRNHQCLRWASLLRRRLYFSASCVKNICSRLKIFHVLAPLILEVSVTSLKDELTRDGAAASKLRSIHSSSSRR